MYHAIVLAQEAAPTTTGGKPPDGAAASPFNSSFILVIILMVVVVYFMLLRPQRKQEKKRQAMLSQMSKNDHVVTIGGVYGIIYSVGDTDVVLKVDERNDVRLRFSKAAIARILSEEEKKTRAETDKKGSE